MTMAIQEFKIYAPNFDMESCSYIDKTTTQLTKDYGKTFNCPCHKFAIDILNKTRKKNYHVINAANFYRFNSGKNPHTKCSDHVKWVEYLNNNIVDFKDKTNAELILYIESTDKSYRKNKADMTSFYQDKIKLLTDKNNILEDKYQLLIEKFEKAKGQNNVPVGDLILV